MEIINKIRKTISYRKATFKYINAMSLMTPSHIYKVINKELFKVEKDDLKPTPAMKLAMKL